MKAEAHIVPNHKLATAIVSSHAVFNYLTAIQNQITFDQKRDALNGLSAYAKFLRKVLALPQKTFWAAKEEAELLESYLKMEKMRFGNSIDFIVRSDSLAGDNDKVVPVLLCIPFVELIVSASLKKETTKPVKLLLDFKTGKGENFLEVNVNRVLPPIKEQERNTEQESRYMLFSQKTLLCEARLTEKCNASHTVYKLFFKS